MAGTPGWHDQAVYCPPVLRCCEPLWAMILRRLPLINRAERRAVGLSVRYGRLEARLGSGPVARKAPQLCSVKAEQFELQVPDAE